jgi:hypothetical protein
LGVDLSPLPGFKTVCYDILGGLRHRLISSSASGAKNGDFAIY